MRRLRKGRGKERRNEWQMADPAPCARRRGGGRGLHAVKPRRTGTLPVRATCCSERNAPELPQPACPHGIVICETTRSVRREHRAFPPLHRFRPSTRRHSARSPSLVADVIIAQDLQCCGACQYKLRRACRRPSVRRSHSPASVSRQRETDSPRQLLHPSSPLLQLLFRGPASLIAASQDPCSAMAWTCCGCGEISIPGLRSRGQATCASRHENRSSSQVVQVKASA